MGSNTLAFKCDATESLDAIMDIEEQKAIDEVFSTYGMDSTFQVEANFRKILFSAVRRMNAIEWLKTNDRVVSTSSQCLANEGIEDSQTLNEALLLILARFCRSLMRRNERAAQHDVLTGRWRVSENGIFCGTIRVARFDFDTDPSDEFKQQVYRQIESRMNPTGAM